MLNPEQWRLVEHVMLEFNRSNEIIAVNEKIDELEKTVKELTNQPLDKQNTKQINELMDASKVYREIANQLRRMKEVN